eukprot:5536593-Heterocapsa_arctica.AAC.1
MSMVPFWPERPEVDEDPGGVLAPFRSGQKVKTAVAAAGPRSTVEVAPCHTRSRSQQDRARCLSFCVQDAQVQVILAAVGAAQP